MSRTLLVLLTGLLVVWIGACADESDEPAPFCQVCPECCATGGGGPGSGGAGGGGSGDLRWLLTAGDEGDQLAQSISFDDDGNVYVAGYFTGDRKSTRLNSSHSQI